MEDKTICRLGVFYDGSYFSGSQKYFYRTDVGWLDFRALHALIQEYVRRKEQGFFDYKLVYGAWFQRLHTTRQADSQLLHKDRNLHHDLMHAGVMVRDLPPDSLWSMAGVGDAQLMMNSIAIAAGGGVRVGLEDNIW